VRDLRAALGPATKIIGTSGFTPISFQELVATRVEQGILGSFRFDRNGDTTLPAVTILRAQRPDGRSTVMSFDGAAIDRVLTPSPDLVPGWRLQIRHPGGTCVHQA
jgi:hypothetical protein